MPPVAAAFAVVATWVQTAFVAVSTAIASFTGLSYAFVANTIGSILISVGSQLVASLFNRRSGASMEAGKVNVRLTEPPRWICAGRMRQGGGVLFGEFDAEGNFWYLIVHSDSILKERVGIYFDDMLVEADGDGNITTNEFCLNNKKELYNGSGVKVSYFQIWTTTYSHGDPTPPAVAALAAAFPTKWTADHKLVGTTYSVVKIKALNIENRYKIYKWRGPMGIGEPSVSIVGHWSDAYDPRDETQVLATPSTHKYSGGNAVLVWAWFRTHRYGRNKPVSSINWDKVAEQAAICDQTVTGLTGDHVRYGCHTSIPENKERIIAEQEILLAMDAQLVFDDDGKCWPRVGYYEAPTLALSRNRDIVAMESVEATNGESETQGVIVRFTDPDANYTVQPSAAWVNPNYYVPGETPQFLFADVLGCQDHNQAMRIAKALGMRSQPLHKIMPVVGLRGLRARQERICAINYDNTFAGDYEIVTPVEIDPVGVFCAFGAVPVDADRWTLLGGEEKPKPVVSETEGAAAPALPSGVALSYANGRIEATFTAPSREDVGYQFQYIKTADITGDQWFDMTVQMQELFAYSGTVSEGTNYSVRQRSFSASGLTSAWSVPAAIGVGLTVDPVSLMTVTPGINNAAVAWRNPINPSFAYVKVFRGTTNVFGAATEIAGPITGGLGQVQQITDTIGAGTYYWWVVAYATDNTPTAPTGPASGTVGLMDMTPGTLPASMTFTRASTGRYYDAAGVRQSAAINVPRFDRNRLTPFAVRGLLIEAAATNVCLNSDTLTGYTLSNITNTTDGTKCSDGVTDMRKLTVVANGSSLVVGPAGSATTGGNVFTCEIKKGSHATTANRFHLYNNSTSTGLIDVFVNMDTGAITYGGFGSITAGATTERLANGNWLLTMPVPTGVTTGNTLSFYAGYLGGSETAGTHVYVGALQNEAGIKPSSYIPTTGATAARSADAAVIDWAARGVADGTITVRYTFDDDSTQDVSTTVASGTSAIPTNLNRRWIKRAERKL